MPLLFNPEPGMILFCDFDTGFMPPEMVKNRPVVVISPRRRRGTGLCTVVPLSTTRPEPLEPFHHQMDPDSLPGTLSDRPTWAKCDVLATVSLKRMDRIKNINAEGKARYIARKVTDEDFLAIQDGVRAALLL